ncbi:MAG: hypothetical protein R3297_08530 [Desulfobulbales bacterium]|nr:hypothetical protein [Desulfobulbales bacterium]
MQCNKFKDCRAQKNSAKSCWEIARENGADYRSYFDICRDCIVRLLKAESPVLSSRQIKGIVAIKTGRAGF